MATIANLIVSIEAQTANLVTGVNAVNSKIDSIGGIAAKAGGLISGAFTATAVIGFANHIADVASEIHDMSEKIGVSAEAVQRFKFAAEQSGATLDDVGRSINFMNRTLSEGNKGLAPLLERIGLSFDQVRAMRPEDAFLAISEAVQKIPDPMLQSEAATKLFGKAGRSSCRRSRKASGNSARRRPSCRTTPSTRSKRHRTCGRSSRTTSRSTARRSSPRRSRPARICGGG
jgi:hypothetical protein